MTPPSALVIVPTFNERDNLPVLLAALMLQPTVSVLVVDARSADGTGEIADLFARRHAGRIDVMHRTARPGLGWSYIDGIRDGHSTSPERLHERRSMLAAGGTRLAAARRTADRTKPLTPVRAMV